MARIVWSEPAVQELEAIAEFVALDKPVAAVRLIRTVFRKVDRPSSCRNVSLPAGPCWVLSLDALIAAKAAMGRPRDQDVIRQLKAIKASQAKGPGVVQ